MFQIRDARGMLQGSLVTNYTPHKLHRPCWMFNDFCLCNYVPRIQDKTNAPTKNGKNGEEKKIEKGMKDGKIRKNFAQ